QYADFAAWQRGHLAASTAELDPMAVTAAPTEQRARLLSPNIRRRPQKRFGDGTEGLRRAG
ncbi:hypothetical protein ACWD4L_45820, partial [Streptomyces sp. NPDC002596]